MFPWFKIYKTINYMRLTNRKSSCFWKPWNLEMVYLKNESLHLQLLYLKFCKLSSFRINLRRNWRMLWTAFLYAFSVMKMIKHWNMTKHWVPNRYQQILFGDLNGCSTNILFWLEAYLRIGYWVDEVMMFWINIRILFVDLLTIDCSIRLVYFFIVLSEDIFQEGLAVCSVNMMDTLLFIIAVKVMIFC